MTQEKIHQIIKEQFAIDYNCSVADFDTKETLVTKQSQNPKARKREESSAFSMLSYNGKLVISCIPELFEWSKEVVAKHCSPEWCFEAGSLISIDRKLQEYGYEIDQVHIFFTPKFITPSTKGDVQIIQGEQIQALEEDERIDEAFLFEDYIEDVLGAVIYDEEHNLLAVAGATANSGLMWEMGVNSFDEGKGYAVSTISKLTEEILKLGKVPYCGTSLSHLASQNTSLRAGLVPTFCELTTRKI